MSAKGQIKQLTQERDEARKWARYFKAKAEQLEDLLAKERSAYLQLAFPVHSWPPPDFPSLDITGGFSPDAVITTTTGDEPKKG